MLSLEWSALGKNKNPESSKTWRPTSSSWPIIRFFNASNTLGFENSLVKIYKIFRSLTRFRVGKSFPVQLEVELFEFLNSFWREHTRR